MTVFLVLYAKGAELDVAMMNKLRNEVIPAAEAGWTEEWEGGAIAKWVDGKWEMLDGKWVISKVDPRFVVRLGVEEVEEPVVEKVEPEKVVVKKAPVVKKVVEKESAVKVDAKVKVKPEAELDYWDGVKKSEKAEAEKKSEADAEDWKWGKVDDKKK